MPRQWVFATLATRCAGSSVVEESSNTNTSCADPSHAVPLGRADPPPGVQTHHRRAHSKASRKCSGA